MALTHSFIGQFCLSFAYIADNNLQLAVFSCLYNQFAAVVSGVVAYPQLHATPFACCCQCMSLAIISIVLVSCKAVKTKGGNGICREGRCNACGLRYCQRMGILCGFLTSYRPFRKAIVVSWRCCQSQRCVCRNVISRVYITIPILYRYRSVCRGGNSNLITSYNLNLCYGISLSSKNKSTFCNFSCSCCIRDSK